MKNNMYKSESKRDLEGEAREWDSGARTPEGWTDAPEAIPRAGAATLISLRVPVQMLGILKAFAARQGVGYQVLIKRWLDERIRQERDRLAASQEMEQLSAVRVADAPPHSERCDLDDLPQDEAKFVQDLVGFLLERARRKKRAKAHQGRRLDFVAFPSDVKGKLNRKEVYD